MYDFEAEYRRIFEMPLEEIKEDIFFRADNFQNEKWYGDLHILREIDDDNSVMTVKKQYGRLASQPMHKVTEKK